LEANSEGGKSKAPEARRKLWGRQQAPEKLVRGNAVERKTKGGGGEVGERKAGRKVFKCKVT